MIVIKARSEAAKTFDELKVDAGKAGEEAGLAYKEGFKEGAGHLEEEIDSKEVGEKTGDDIGEQIKEHVSDKIAEVEDDPKIGESGRGIGDKLGTSMSDEVNTKLKEGIGKDLDDELQKKFNLFSSGGKSDESAPKIDYSDIDELQGRFDRFANGTFEKIKVDVDDESVKKVENKLKAVGGEVSQDWTGAFSSVFGGGNLKTGAIIAAVAAAAPLAGGLVSTAVGVALAGGPIGAGLIKAFNGAEVQKAFDVFKNNSNKIFTEFSDNFAPVEAKFFTSFSGMLTKLKPEISSLGKELGPAATQLSNGLLGGLKILIPDILSASKAAIPVLDQFSSDLPMILDAVGRFFKIIAGNSANTAAFWDDFAGGISLAIVDLAHLINGLTDLYFKLKNVALYMTEFFAAAFAKIIDDAAAAFGWIPGIGPKLKKAAAEANANLQSIARNIDAIHSREIEIRIKTVFTGVGSTAVGIAALLHKATGGIIGGSASGASPSGLTWVGENGPELISAPAGSRVYSNGDSNRMAGSGGSGSPIQVNFMLDGQMMASAMVDHQRRIVRSLYGGNVQAAYGKG